MIAAPLAHVLLPLIVGVSILLMLARPWGVAEVYWVGGGVLLLVVLRLVPLRLAGKAVAEGTDVYLFLIGMMVLSELAREHGVFDWLASVAVREAQGSCARLFTLVYGIGTLVTIFMSNDATAVVLTPAILTAVRKAKVEPLPNLFACALIANAASFVLPISNPANLVVFHQGMPPLGQWLASFGVPSVLSIAATYAVMRVVFRKELSGTIDEEVKAEPLSGNGKIVLGGLALMILVLLGASAMKKDLGLPTCLAALAITAVVSIKARKNPLELAKEISWKTLALVAGLFILVDAVESVGALKLTQAALAWAQGLAPAVGAVVTSFAVGVANNLVNNLPLGLIAGGTLQAAHTKGLITNAVLIGVDLGPNLSITGSLATILWLLALRKEKLEVSFWDFLKIGAVAMPVAMLASLGGGDCDAEGGWELAREKTYNQEMGRIRILSDQVANQIAAGEVVERPASVVKELLENAIDAGATRIRIEVEGGGRKLIRIVDNGCGMVRDDALLAFERHATSKLRSSDDLLSISTLGFRGEALPSIASVARVQLATRTADDAAGTEVQIAGGKILRVDEAGMPCGTTLAVRDLFFNTPARRKFLKTEQTELSHIAALVTHYALAHPAKHLELHTATQALLVAPAVASAGDRLYQIFGRETASLMLPVTAEMDFARAGLPEPPPWKRDAEYEPPEPGYIRVSGFVSKPELQKLNRNAIYVFVNQRLIRDRLVIHALVEAYRNVIPPGSFPVVLLFLEMPPQEVDVNVHPAKTEVRFRQPSFVHDFIRDMVRTTLMTARPATSFAAALHPAHGAASSLLLDVSPMSGGPEQPLFSPHDVPQSEGDPLLADAEPFSLRSPIVAASPGRLEFAGQGIAVGYEEAVVEAPPATLNGLATLKPLGQLRDSFILAVNDEGLWIVDQHVAHERVLFEKILRDRAVEAVQRQRLLMPLLVDLLPAQMIRFAELAEELDRNGFEAEPFGPRTLAIKAAPVGLEGRELERMLEEVLGVPEREQQAENAEARRRRIAASIACHAAIKVNTPLDAAKIDWLLVELAKTEHPTSCPHGRPIALRYSYKDVQKAFQRI